MLTSSILFASSVTSASEFASLASCYSAPCNKYGLFFLPEVDCSNLLPVKIAWMSLTTDFLLKVSSISRDWSSIDQPNAGLWHKMDFFNHYGFLYSSTQVYSSVSVISSHSNFD